MKQAYLKKIALSLFMTSLSLSASNAMEETIRSYRADQLQEYSLINAIKGKSLQDAVFFLTDYCAQNLNAADDLYQESRLYDAWNNPDIKNTDRLFIFDILPPSWSKTGEIVFATELKMCKTPELDVLKQRFLAYSPYAICLALASLLRHEEAQDRQNKINSLMGIDDDTTPVWSPDYTKNIKVSSYNKKDYFSRENRADYKETLIMMSAAQKVCIDEWCKTVQLKNGKRQKSIYEYFFQTDCQNSFYTWSASEETEISIFFPPHLKNIYEAEKNLSHYNSGSNPFHSETSFRTDLFHSLIVEHMEKTLSFCENIADTDKYDLILEVLKSSHMDGILGAINNSNQNFINYCKRSSPKIDLNAITLFSDKYAKVFKDIEILFGKYLILKEEVLKKEDQNLKIEDYKPLILSVTSAAKIAKSSDLKVKYCDQALEIYEKFLERFNEQITKYTNQHTQRCDAIERWAESLWRKGSDIAEWAAEASDDVETKAEYYEKSISLYKKWIKDSSWLPFTKIRLAKLYRLVAISTNDVQKKIENYKQSIASYERWCTEKSKWIDDKFKDRYGYIYINHSDLEERVSVLKDFAVVCEEFSQLVEDPIIQKEYLGKAKIMRLDADIKRQNEIIEEKKILRIEEEKEAQIRKEEKEKLRKQQLADRWK